MTAETSTSPTPRSTTSRVLFVVNIGLKHEFSPAQPPRGRPCVSWAATKMHNG